MENGQYPSSPTTSSQADSIPSIQISLATSSGITTPLEAPKNESPPDQENDQFAQAVDEDSLFMRPRVRPPPRRAMTSFENLVALANHQERLREARKMVWRDRGEPVSELKTVKECLDHALRGGFRSGALAFSIRASFNVVLALIRIRRIPRDIRGRVIIRAILGLDSWRFAAMLSTFTAVYKFLLNALPILIPAINPAAPPSMLPYHNHDHDELAAEHPTTDTTVSNPITTRKARLSLSKHAQELLILKRTRKWHAALAGAIAGGLAIMLEARSRRGVISQQMFVRGLQGSYNSYTKKRGIHVPYGDVLVFTLACGQIMYGFLLRPDTLPRSYSTWINQAGKIPPECVRMNHDMVRNHTFEMADLDRILSRKDITATNKSILLDLKNRFLALPTHIMPPPSPTTPYFPHYTPCSSTHPWITECTIVPLDRFAAVFRLMLPIYGALHLIPAILFKRSTFFKNPGQMMIKAGLGTMRSSAFLGVFVVIYQSLFCFKHNLHELLTRSRMRGGSSLALPQYIIDLLISKGSFWLLGSMCGLSLFIEDKKRRGDLTMYVLPKGLESLWIMARGKGLVFRTGNWGDMLLTSLGMAMVMGTYQNDPQHLSGLVRRILYQFIGPN